MKTKMQSPEPGSGQGAGKPKQGEGGREKCECSKCGHIQAHERGTPCIEQKCSECGAAMSPVVESANIEGMMVFKPGTHNGRKFTDKEIEAVVENFKKLKGQIRPKLKITHKENQKSVAGLASYGDVTDVYAKIVKGIKGLFVKIVNVPEQVVKWIKDRRFPERSIELWPEIKVDGKVYKWVLRNVSLLGHEAPAVPGMEPIKGGDEDDGHVTVALAFDDDEAILDIEDVFEVSQNNEDEDTDLEGGDNGMKDVIEKMQIEIDELRAAVTSKDDEIAKMKDESQVKVLQDEKVKLKERLTKLESSAADVGKLQKEADKGKEAIEKIANMEANEKKRLVESRLEGWKKDRHMNPRNEPIAKALMESFGDAVIKLSVPDGDGSKDVESTQADLLDQLICSYNLGGLEEISTDGDGASEGAEDKTIVFSAGDRKGTSLSMKGGDLDAKVRKYMKENKDTSYEDALIAVS